MRPQLKYLFFFWGGGQLAITNINVKNCQNDLVCLRTSIQVYSLYSAGVGFD